MSKFNGDQGFFILLRREGAVKKNGHIIYHSSKLEYIEFLRAKIEPEYIAAFDSAGKIVPLNNFEDNLK